MQSSKTFHSQQLPAFTSLAFLNLSEKGVQKYFILLLLREVIFHLHHFRDCESVLSPKGLKTWLNLSPTPKPTVQLLWPKIRGISLAPTLGS